MIVPTLLITSATARKSKSFCWKHPTRTDWHSSDSFWYVEKRLLSRLPNGSLFEYPSKYNTGLINLAAEDRIEVYHRCRSPLYYRTKQTKMKSSRGMYGISGTPCLIFRTSLLLTDKLQLMSMLLGRVATCHTLL